MPNYVKNVWKIKGIKPEEIEYLLNKLTVKYTTMIDDGGPGKIERKIDFDLIIPEPRFKQDCPKDYRVNKDSHVAPAPGREWFNWYEWRCKYWGTKWNASDSYTIVKKTQITFVFSTAWNCPTPIALELAKLGYDMELKYADEDYGSNCGIITYDAKAEESKKWTVTVKHELPDPGKFAKYLWANY